jgi:hypothetical protein
VSKLYLGLVSKTCIAEVPNVNSTRSVTKQRRYSAIFGIMGGRRAEACVAMSSKLAKEPKKVNDQTMTYNAHVTASRVGAICSALLSVESGVP